MERASIQSTGCITSQWVYSVLIGRSSQACTGDLSV